MITLKHTQRRLFTTLAGGMNVTKCRGTDKTIKKITAENQNQQQNDK